MVTIFSSISIFIEAKTIDDKRDKIQYTLLLNQRNIFLSQIQLSRFLIQLQNIKERIKKLIDNQFIQDYEEKNTYKGNDSFEKRERSFQEKLLYDQKKLENVISFLENKAIERSFLFPFIYFKEIFESYKNSIIFNAIFLNITKYIKHLYDNIKTVKKNLNNIELQKKNKNIKFLNILENFFLKTEIEKKIFFKKKHLDFLMKQENFLEENLDFLQLQKFSNKNDPQKYFFIRDDFKNFGKFLTVSINGRLVKIFNDSLSGEILETKPGAIIISPEQGIVRYIGSFRSYGKILILDIGFHYYLIFIGLDKLNVVKNQELLQGEIIGNMQKSNSPILYIEIRKHDKIFLERSKNHIT